MISHVFSIAKKKERLNVTEIDIPTVAHVRFARSHVISSWSIPLHNCRNTTLEVSGIKHPTIENGFILIVILGENINHFKKYKQKFPLSLVPFSTRWAAAIFARHEPHALGIKKIFYTRKKNIKRNVSFLCCVYIS